MTTTADARKAIYDLFLTEWANTTYLVFDNEQHDPPVGLPWVRLSVRHQTSEQKCLGEVGHRLYNRRGLVFLQLFTPENSGQASMDALIETARPIFEGRRLFASGVDFTNATVRELGISEGWNAALIEIGFNYDERR